MSNFQKSDKSARIRKDIMIYIDSRINQVLYNLDHFTHKDFKNEILRTGIDMSINSSNRILARLIACQLIIRYKRDHYQTIKENLRFEFQYDLSFEANTIHQSISKTYPLITYQIWDLTVLNQFVYHLFGHNCIFVEVESNLEETIFEFLSRNGYHVLLSPNDDDFYHYAKDNTVIVRKLISQAPENLLDRRKIALERLLVDIVTDKLLQSIISRSEIPDIYQECLAHCNINLKKVMRYASRRNAKERINKIIEEVDSNDQERKLSGR